jgi:hypothetical protein
MYMKFICKTFDLIIFIKQVRTSNGEMSLWKIEASSVRSPKPSIDRYMPFLDGKH